MSLKNKFEDRRGSALLIVLGMLSFMVVSAVGFSIYMRQGRLPSSYLRRNVSSRYLVKAALANAIEDLEGGFMSKYDIGEDDDDDPDVGRFYGIYDDPYPGIGADMGKSGTQTGRRKFVSGASKSSYRVNYMENGDFWFHRVFCPFGPLPHPDSNQEALEEPPLTVPTLTLEALAYLPPAIIDDVRKVSRLTRTAQWRTLPYEAGRYAYTAVNVSDLFDVNRLRADVARNSGTDRISLGSLCTPSPDQPTTVEQANVDELEDVLAEIENKKVNGNVTPFTSLADFNLVAAGLGKYGYAPFMDYIGKSSANMLADSDSRQANSLFVTDTWFPSTNANGQVVYDLAGGHQPFTDFNANGFLQVGTRVNAQDQVGQIFLKNLGIGLVSLYDYLDSDSIPMSLALPTVEAVPMVVGVSVPVGLQPSFGAVGQPITQQVGGLKGTVTDSEGNATPVNDISLTRTCQQMGIQSFGNRVQVKVVTCFPFKRMVTTKRLTGKSYSVRGLMRVYIAPAGMNCRVSDPNTALHPLQANWKNSNPTAAGGVASFLSDTRQISQFSSTDVKATADAIDDSVTLMFSNLNLEMPLYWEITEDASSAKSATPGTAVPDGANYNASYKSLGKLKDEATALHPLAADGGIDRTWEDTANGNFDPKTAYPNGITPFEPATAMPGTYRIYAAVWVQVLEGGKVVDMVPATVTDDVECLDSNVPDNGVTQRVCGDGAPTLNFMSTTDFTYDNAKTVLSATPDFTWKALYAVDPRYNHAPENWFATSSSGATKSEWMTELGLTGSTSDLLGRDGRDADIFMFVSDQEYLQSMGELQFLPAIHDFDGNANFPLGDLPDLTVSAGLESQKPFGERIGYAASKDKFACREFFWRTYTAYRTEAGQDNTTGTDYNLNPYRLKQQGAGFSGADATIVSGAGGFRLNPFSEDARVISAAIVGTPFDYYVASTNDNQIQSGGLKNQVIGSIDYTTMMSTYSFGRSAVAQMSDTELADIADEIQDAFSGMTTFDMNKSWGELKWQLYTDTAQINDNNKKFLADDLILEQPLHSVDRKYLYSFWRECFDNRQQLFLMFVRAEPTAIGGGAAGSVTSAQLGGRAVALVWRDPSVPSGGSTRPARTAINSREEFRTMKRDCAPHKTRVLFYHQFD